MHFEIFVEDSSGELLVSTLLPKILGENGACHTWHTHKYKGIGRLPKDLAPKTDANKRILLDHLPRLLRGLSKKPGVDWIVVLMDTDGRDCARFLTELVDVAKECGVESKTLFRLAIEEIESWYFGDRVALLAAYPRAKLKILNAYRQDSICGTWEKLADATYSGGIAEIKRRGWPTSGALKHEWAGRIGPLLEPSRNSSPSFRKFRDGLHRISKSD